MTTILQFGGYQPERSVHTRAARALAAAMNGRLQLEITPEITKTGRAAADLLSMTENGELQMCYFSSSYLVSRVPELGILDLPFEGADRNDIWRRLHGDAGARLERAVAARTGYELLGFWDNGMRHISNGTRAIRTPADCEGLSIRTLDNKFHQAIFAALGFVPRFVDVKDLGAEVRNGTIDAQENPLTNLVNFDLHKTHRFVAMTSHFFGIALLLGNRAALSRLTHSERSTLDAAITEATWTQRALAAAEDDACLGLLEADGVTVTMPDAIDLAWFRAAVGPVVTAETAKLDPALLNSWRQ